MADINEPTVATPSGAVEEMRPRWEMCEALLGGTEDMRKAGEVYLPKWPKEDADAYKARLAVSVLLPVYKRTVETLAAKPFSKPVTVGDDVPAQLQEWLQDVDMEGRNLDRFASDVMECAMGYGLCGILVDFPTAESVPATAAGVRTQAAEQAAGLRPYWVHIAPEQIIGWRAKRVGSSWQILQLRLMECVEEPDGEWGTKEVEQVRVLEPGKWETWREVKTASGKEWQFHAEGVTTIDFVPFVPVYGKRAGFMRGEPPLIEVAYLNVAHWQSASDQQNLLHVARVPILTAINVSDNMGPGGEVKPWELTIGAGQAVRITGQDADLKYVEHTGAGLEAGDKDLKNLEDRMRQAGAEMLVLAPTASTRIEAAGDNEVAMCALQRMALAMEDALDQAMQYTARWVGQQEGGHVELFKDFGALTLQEASAQLLLDMTTAGKLSDETLFSEIKRRGVVSADVTWEGEKERLGQQGPGLGMLGGSADPGSTGNPADHAPLDLTPIVEAIRAGLEALKGAQPQAMDLPALLAAVAAQQGGQPITVNAPAPDMAPLAAALAALQPAQVNVTGTDTAANSALVETVAAGVAAMTSAAEALQKVAQELPAAVAAAAPKTIAARVDMPKRTARAKFTTDAAGNITGATLTDE